MHFAVAVGHPVDPRCQIAYLAGVLLVLGQRASPAVEGLSCLVFVHQEALVVVVLFH